MHYQIKTNKVEAIRKYSVVLEIQVEAENQIEAAKQVQSMLKEHDSEWMFHIQEDGKKEIITVDLYTDEVEIVQDYEPIIKLSVEEIVELSKDPNQGFDICCKCDCVQPYGTMQDLEEDSFNLVCKNCK